MFKKQTLLYIKTALLLTAFLSNSFFCTAQIFSKKQAKYSYQYFKIGNDSIKCKRITKEGRNNLSTKYSDKDVLELACIPYLELNLNQYRDCVANPQTARHNMCDFNSENVAKNIKWAKELNIDTKDYENELNFYKGLLEKRINQNQKLVERENKLNDSINFSNNEKLRINDSINKAKKKIEREKFLQEVSQKQKEDSLKNANEDKMRKADLIKRYGIVNGTFLFNYDFKLGFTKEMCLYALGEPDHKTLAQTKEGVSEFWEYRGRNVYLKFLNNKVVFVDQP